MISIFQNKKDRFIIDNIKINRYIFKYINSNMYVIVDGKNALVIDPHEDSEILDKLEGVKNIDILLTHEHPDHISGIYWLQEKFNCKIYCTKYCADYISQERNVRPILITFVLEERDRQNGTNVLDKFNKEFVPHTYNADITFEEQYFINWCSHKLEFFKILGHSKGSCGIILDDVIVFTGDSLMKELPVITRFPGGSRSTYINEMLPMLEKRLKSDMWILPGHGEPFQLKEIMKDGKLNVEIR